MIAAQTSSIRRKLLAVVLLTTLAALLLAIAAMVVYELRNSHQGWLNDISTQAELLGRTSAPALAFDDPKVAQENLGLLRYRPKVRAAAIYSAKGALFATYRPASDEQPFPKLPEADGARVNGDDLVVFRRIVSDNEILGTVYLRAHYELYDRLLGYLGIALVVSAAAMLVAFAVSARLQGVLTRPLLEIASVAREVVNRRDYSRRAQKMSDDEVGTVADAINDMLAEIERRTAELERLNREQAHEVAERTRAEQENKRLANELEVRVQERTVQLETANHELEAFCYSVSHDLRAPLRSIDGFSQALVEDCKDLGEGAQRYLTRIRSSSQRMGQLIEDLLNLSKVSRGTLERRAIDVSEIATQVAAELQSRDPERVVTLSIWEGMKANADPRLLRIVFENLLNNAWKFTAKCDAPRIAVGWVPDGERTAFYVRDNGAGFDMAYADKLFGAFQRLHAASEFAGTGIGLATCQRIVHRHGGRIWADAQVGKGAAFFFTLG